MACTELLRTQAFLDGELEQPAATKAANHLETCAECQALRVNTLLLKDAIRSGAVRHRAPPFLRDLLVKSLAGGGEGLRPPTLLGGAGRGFWAGLASGAGAMGLAAAFALWLILPPMAQTLVDTVTDAHTRALMEGRDIQVASSDHHTVKPWFAGRIAMSPPVADFAAQGFKLVGGRVDSIDGADAAVVVYRHGHHEIDLFAWADRGERLPDTGMRHGYRSLFWRRGDLDFSAVSDMEADELKKFVSLVRSEPE